MDLRFASSRKLCTNSVFDEKMNTVAFILCEKFLFSLRFGLFPFRRCIPLTRLSDIDIFWDSVSDLKTSTRSVIVYTFNWLRRKNPFPENMDRK